MTNLLNTFRSLFKKTSAPRAVHYHVNSFANGSNGEEIVYLMETNGIIREGAGNLNWLSSDQRFQADKFKLCPIGGAFVIHNHSDVYYGHCVVSHYYSTKLTPKGDVAIHFDGQSSRGTRTRPKYDLLKIPADFTPTDRPKSGSYRTEEGSQCFYFG